MANNRSSAHYQLSSSSSESTQLETEGIDYAITARSEATVEVKTTGLLKSKGIGLQKTAPAKTVKVEYSVEYSYEDKDVAETPIIIEPVTVVIPAGGSALQVMENAAVKHGPQYYFTAKFYGDNLGFDIETINGFPKSPSECYWEFLIRLPDGSVKPSKLGVSSYYFDTDEYGMIMRYTKTPLPKMVKVNYSVECKDTPLKPVSVYIPVGGSALQVMENAANKFGKQYFFTAKYYGSLQGFFIESINGVASDNWEFLIKTPDGHVKRPHEGVSAYHFEKAGYSMIMRLKND